MTLKRLSGTSLWDRLLLVLLGFTWATGEEMKVHCPDLKAPGRHLLLDRSFLWTICHSDDPVIIGFCLEDVFDWRFISHLNSIGSQPR